MYIFYFFVPWMFIHACGYEIFSHARACIRLHEFSHPCVIAMSVVCCSVCCSVCCRACCHTYAQRIYVHFCWHFAYEQHIYVIHFDNINLSTQIYVTCVHLIYVNINIYKIYMSTLEVILTFTCTWICTCIWIHMHTLMYEEHICPHTHTHTNRIFTYNYICKTHVSTFMYVKHMCPHTHTQKQIECLHIFIYARHMCPHLCIKKTCVRTHTHTYKSSVHI